MSLNITVYVIHWTLYSAYSNCLNNEFSVSVYTYSESIKIVGQIF